MPTAISGAVGTARQFTPQPDNGYIGHYAGVSPASIAARTGRTEQLAQNIAQLTAALGSYRTSHEHYLNDSGLISAQRMIQGMSEADIRKLDAIDAAQQEGYADALSNPYFKAHAERLRGGFVSTVMKNAYDEKYAMTPARTAAEEAKRYNEFAKDWQETNLSGDSAPVNMTAFSAGFNENQLVNMGSLMAAWEKKNYENEVTTTMASVQNQLQDIIKNSPELLQTNGEVTRRTQEAFNNLRLMGLPANMRAKLLNDFAEEFIKTGHIDEKRLTQMMENITIQTGFDGSEMKASELLPMMSLKTMSAEYSAQFHTQEKYDWVQAQIKSGSLDGALNEIMGWRQTDPEKAREYNKLVPQIKAGIEQARAAAARAMRIRQSASGRGNGNGRVSDPQTIRDIIGAWQNESDMVYGKPISAYSIDSNDLYSTAMPILQDLIAQGDFKQVYRLMDMPQMSALRTSVSASLANTLSSLMPSDDGGVNIGTNAPLRSLIGACINNTAAIANTFGGDLAREASVLKTLSEAFGGGDSGYEQALRLYALSNQTKRQNPDLHTANESAAKGHMAGFTIDGVPHAGGSTDWADFGLSCNSFVQDEFTKLWTTYYDAGIEPEQALRMINDTARQNYETYHWGVYPKTVHYNIGTDNDAHWFRKSLDAFVYATCEGGSTVDYEGTTIGYNPTTRIFTFTSNSMGRTRQVTLSQLHQKALELNEAYIKQQGTGEAAEEQALDMDAINAERANPYGYIVERGID